MEGYKITNTSKGELLKASKENEEEKQRKPKQNNGGSYSRTG